MNLEQLEAQYKKLGEKINNLKNPPEEFYKIGDVFKIEGSIDGCAVLSLTSLDTYTMIDILKGNRWINPIHDSSFKSDKISKSFVEKLAGGREVTKVTVKIIEQAYKDGWIMWSGGECPVDNDTVVVVRFRDDGEEPNFADYWSWFHRNSGNDIIAYRVLK